jgi:hypothetical protein
MLKKSKITPNKALNKALPAITGVVTIAALSLIILPATLAQATEDPCTTNATGQIECTATTNLNLTIKSVLNLALDNCPDNQKADSAKLDLSVTPRPTEAGGSFVSDCQTLNVKTNLPGYSLTAKASSSNPNYIDTSNNNQPIITNALLYTNPAPPSPFPIIPATANTTPAKLTTANTWGFAVTGDAVSPTLGFNNSDTYYTANDPDDPDYSTNYDLAKNNQYAELPITDLTIHPSDPNTTTSYSDDYYTFYYAALVDSGQPAGTYSTTITYTVIGEIVPCQWDNTISFDDENCQEPSIACSSGPAFKGRIGDIRNAGTTTAAWTIGDTGIATDSRGNGQDYCIGKLADNNIWMLNNLKLGYTDPTAGDKHNGTITLTPADTNIPVVNGDERDYFTLPVVDNTDYSSYDDPRLYALTSDDQNGYSDPDLPNSEETNINSENFAGYYYNWPAATAGEDTSSIDGYDETVAPYSICPKGWKLPTGGWNGNEDFYKLYDAYNGDYDAFQFTGPFRGVFAGHRYGSGWFGQGGWGHVWSSVAGDSYYAFYLGFGSGFVDPDDGWSRYYGLSVRCLLQ